MIKTAVLWNAARARYGITLGALALLLTACACQSRSTPTESLKPTQETASAGSLAPLYPLGKETFADFRSAFNEGKDHTRFIVALSPT
jgi:hypothetical protein